jgi:hypothetical protein
MLRDVSISNSQQPERSGDRLERSESNDRREWQRISNRTSETKCIHCPAMPQAEPCSYASLAPEASSGCKHLDIGNSLASPVSASLRLLDVQFFFVFNPFVFALIFALVSA